MKTHLSFGTSDLSASVRFYSALLDATPVKRYDDYALFVTESPGLELALDRRASVASPSDGHFGVAVASTDQVDAAIARLERIGLPLDVEREETCCYAKQTKVWASDPEGRRWEVYAVHEEVPERDDACCAN